MTGFAKWKIIAYAAGIFLVGAVTGGVVAVGLAKREMSVSPHPHDIASHMRDRLRRSLDLTPDQVQKIDPIIEKSGEEIHGIHAETMDRVGKVMAVSYEQIAAFLNPAQKAKLDQLEKERAEFSHHGHRFHSHPSPGTEQEEPPQPGSPQS